MVDGATWEIINFAWIFLTTDRLVFQPMGNMSDLILQSFNWDKLYMTKTFGTYDTWGEPGLNFHFHSYSSKSKFVSVIQYN